jgi:uncharacterized protein YbaP (TraB family)
MNMLDRLLGSNRFIGITGVGLAVAALFLFVGQLPQGANPALWRVEGPKGERAYLFGTIHALPHPAAWRTEKVTQALEASDRIMVEIADLKDQARLNAAFEAVAHTKGLPPLDARVEAGQRPALRAAMGKIGRDAGSFGDTETWAAALMLARGQNFGDPAYGVDRQLLAQRGGLPVVELEGAVGQFAVFDRLPEMAQRRLLADSLAGEADDPAALAQGWRKGDMAMLDALTRQGMLADPILRAALYVGRNRTWSAAIVAAMARGERPFVAVGAAHMAGADGLPAMLAARGYRVTRIE